MRTSDDTLESWKDQVSTLRLEIETLKRERDAQYEENVNRIAAEGAAILRAEQAEVCLSRLSEQARHCFVGYAIPGVDISHAMKELVFAFIAAQEFIPSSAGFSRGDVAEMRIEIERMTSTIREIAEELEPTGDVWVGTLPEAVRDLAERAEAYEKALNTIAGRRSLMFKGGEMSNYEAYGIAFDALKATGAIK